jgi:hypothetical protein
MNKQAFLDNDGNDKAVKIVSNPIYNDVSKISTDTIIKEFILNDRYYLHTNPQNTTLSYDLILFYHAIRPIGLISRCSTASAVLLPQSGKPRVGYYFVRFLLIVFLL